MAWIWRTKQGTGKPFRQPLQFSGLEEESLKSDNGNKHGEDGDEAERREGGRGGNDS